MGTRAELEQASAPGERRRALAGLAIGALLVPAFALLDAAMFREASCRP